MTATYLVNGKSYRPCDCPSDGGACPRGLDRTASTASYSKCLIPVESGICAEMAPAKQEARAPELLNELQMAHQIIRNALNLMTGKQKWEWALANNRDRVIGEGTTRAHEREAVIAKAREQS